MKICMHLELDRKSSSFISGETWISRFFTLGQDNRFIRQETSPGEGSVFRLLLFLRMVCKWSNWLDNFYHQEDIKGWLRVSPLSSP